MSSITEKLPEGITDKDVRFNWNYQRWGLYHNALIEIQSLVENNKSALAQKINQIIVDNQEEMNNYDKFFIAAFDRDEG